MVRNKTPKRTRPNGVVDLQVARAERLVEEIKTLADELASNLAETVGLVVDGYRAWERRNPDVAPRPYDRMEMIRLGFVGPAGFDRCHREERAPRAAYDPLDPIFDDDRAGSEVLMCPLMEESRCEPAWRAMGTAPCELLLLEVYQAVGKGADDWKVREIVDDFGRSSPDAYRKTFEQAAKLVRKAEKDREVRGEGS